MPESSSELLDILVRLRDQASGELKGLDKNIKKVSKTTQVASRALNKFRLGIGKISSTIFSLKGAFLTLGVGLLARSFVKAAATAESYRVRLVTLLGDVEKANKLFQDMSEFASGVSFSYEEIMGAATNLSGVMQGGAEEIKKYMPIIADLAATAGMGITETASQIIRMYSAGAAAADMFRERGILAMMGFVSGVSTTAEQTRKKLISSWEDPASKFRGAAKALARTWDGMLSMMGDAWFQFRNEVMEAGVFDLMKAALDTLLAYINKLKEEGDFASFAKGMGDNVVGAMIRIAQATAIVIDIWKGWKMLFLALTVAFSSFALYVNKGLSQLFWSLDNVKSKLLKIIDVLEIIQQLSPFGFMVKQLAGPYKVIRDMLEMSKDASGFTAENAEEWKAVGEHAERQLRLLVDQETSWSKINKLIALVKQTAAGYSKEADAAKKRLEKPAAGPPEAKFANKLKSELIRMSELTKTTLAQVKSYYDANLITLKEYYDQRKVLLDQQFQAEVAHLQKLLSVEKSPDKKLAIQDKIYQKEQQYQRDSIKLTDERTVAEKKLTEEMTKREEVLLKEQANISRMLGQMKARVEQEAASALAAVFQREQEEMERRHETELQMLRDLKAKEADIEDAFRLQQAEKDRLLADQRKRINESVYENFKSTIDALGNMYSELYESSGKKSKAFFYAEKAVAIARVTMNVAEAITKALAQGGFFFGPVMAGIIGALGAIQIANIMRQRPNAYEEGGLVSGKKGRDNIWARLSDSEYVMSAKAVRKYGIDFMESINRGVLKAKDMMTPNIPYDIARPRAAFAGGGLVTAGSSQGINFILNLTNKSSVPLTGESRGQKIGVDQVVTEVILKDIDKRGDIFKAWRGARP